MARAVAESFVADSSELSEVEMIQLAFVARSVAEPLNALHYLCRNEKVEEELRDA